MEKKRYEKLVVQYTPKVPWVKNAIVAFLVGGGDWFIRRNFITFLCSSLGSFTSRCFGLYDRYINLFCFFIHGSWFL